MTQPKTTVLTQISLAFFVIGLATALLVQVIYTWGVIESTQFDRSDPGLFAADEPVDSFRCPLLITSGETATVTASFSNPTELERTRIVRANVSDGFIIARREITTDLLLAPGETEVLSWEISSDDAAWERFVFVRVFALRSGAAIPAQVSTCSVLLLNVAGIPGSWLATGLLALSILGSIGGLAGWVLTKRPLSASDQPKGYLMAVVTGVILFGLYVSLNNYWVINILLLVVVLFLLISIGLYGTKTGENV